MGGEGGKSGCQRDANNQANHTEVLNIVHYYWCLKTAETQSWLQCRNHYFQLPPTYQGSEWKHNEHNMIYLTLKAMTLLIALSRASWKGVQQSRPIPPWLHTSCVVKVESRIQLNWLNLFSAPSWRDTMHLRAGLKQTFKRGITEASTALVTSQGVDLQNSV